MKHFTVVLFLCACLSMGMSSCGTLFSSSKQDITFKGVPGTDIFDNKGKRLGEIGKNGFGTLPIRKKIGSKKIVAQLDGYASREASIKSKFNPITVLNLVAPVPWVIDLCTGKVCKYSNDVVDVTLMPVDDVEINTLPPVKTEDDGWLE